MSNPFIINEEVSFTVSGNILDGILTRQDAKTPCPAIILLQGSDRGSMKDPYYAVHAENLIRAGLAVLRYDGPGRATATNAGFETLEYRAEEAIAAVKYLQTRPDIHAGAVGLWGISQGGWICQMAAALYDGVAFIIPVSGPGVTPAEQEVYRVEAESRAAGFEDNEIAKAILMRRLMVDIVLSKPIYKNVNLSEARRLGDGPWSEMAALTYGPDSMELAAEFEKIVTIFKRIQDERWATFLHLDQVLRMLDSLPSQAWGMAKAQMQAMMTMEPAQYLTKIRCPVLAIFGENDTSTPVERSISLYRKYLGEAGNKAFTYQVFPNADHTIHLGKEFADGYFELMLSWLSKRSVG